MRETIVLSLIRWWLRSYRPVHWFLSPDTTVCISAGTLQLDANLGGGTWSGDESIDGTGLIALEDTRGRGERFTYTYRYLPGTSCAQESRVEVEVINLEDLVTAGDNQSLCEGIDNLVLTGGSPVGGRWSGAGIIDPTSGEIDPSTLQLDTTYRYRYMVESAQASACAAEAEKSVIVHSNPTASFQIEGLACIDETFTLVNRSENANSYEWDFGDSDTSSIESPTHQYSEKGEYTITLESVFRIRL